jgi:hypothetical protein
MCGKTRRDKIRNDNISEGVGVALIVEKMMKIRLRWFGHVERRLLDHMKSIPITRDRGRARKTIRETIKKNLVINELYMIYDRTLWRHLIHLADLS